ncbi:DsbA family protein [Bdellovibrio sp. HCB337]|uniref:vitamin K epoxide reductase/DsbA family protein n=1 Tax=Bdellovibrio sp. HCB337 TaxID=3394358 RepID=UPI0039A5167C
MKNTAQKKTLVLLAIIFTVAAIGIHLYLNKHHIDLKLGTSTASSVCNVSEKLNCDTAASSPYAELFGIPMALLGAFFNGLILVFLILTRYNMTENSERTERYTFYFSSFVLLVSLVMGGISLLVLKSACPFCMATYGLSIVTWILLWMAFRPNLSYIGGDIQDMFTSEKWILGTLISVPILALLVNGMTLDSYGYQELKRTADSSFSAWQASPEQNFDLQNGLQYQSGQGEAKVTIVEFADFLCSHCKAAYPALHAFAKSHPDVKLIFKNFPLDGACNSAVTHRGDGKRCDLSYAVYCSEKVNQKGWAAHNYIFDNQEEFFSKPMDQILEGICKTTGADCAQVKTCMNSEETHEAVKKMAAEGEKAQIAGTPSVFLNGRNLPGGQFLPVLESVYRNIKK